MAGKTKGKNLTEAVAYLRTSSAANVGQDKDSAKRQRAAIERFAKSSGFQVVDEFYDEAVSGADAIETREGFAALLDRIEGNGVRTVIVEDVSRFARELLAQELGIALLIARGVRLLTSSGDDLTASEDPTRKMMRQIAGAFAEYEKARLVGKLKAARDRKRAGKDGKAVKVEGRQSPPDQLRARLLKGPTSEATADTWAETVRACLPPKLAAKLPQELTCPVDKHLAAEIADGYAKHLAEAIAMAKRLYRASPKNGERRSLRQVSAELAARGYLNEHGKPFNPNSVRSLIKQRLPEKD